MSYPLDNGKDDAAPANAVPRDRPAAIDLSQVYKTAGLRFVLMPCTAGATLATASILVRQEGVERYGYIMLVVGLSQLLPFSDLGVGAAVTNAVATTYGNHDRLQAERVLLTCMRLLILSAAAICSVALCLLLLHLWSPLLSVSESRFPGFNASVAMVLGLFAATVPLGIGQRVLLGVGRNDISIMCGTLASIVPLVLVALLASVGASLQYYPLAFLVGAVASGGACTYAAGRVWSLHWLGLVSKLGSRYRFPGISVSSTALPMLVIMVGLPLGLQSDRIILSHLSDPLNLGSYSLAAQIYVPAWSLLVSAGMALWPVFAGARVIVGHERQVLLWRSMLKWFGLAGLCLALAYQSLSPVALRFLAPGRVSNMSLLAAFSFLLLVQAVHLPTGMFLNDAEGLRFQAKCVAFMLVLNVALSLYLTPSVGAPGPVFASAISILFAQLLPGILHVLKGRTAESPGREETATASIPTAPVGPG